MAEKTALQKMGVKPGQSLLVLNAPGGDLSRLGPPPGKAATRAGGDTFDVVQVFAATQAELSKHLPEALGGLKPGGSLWLAYPKGSSGIESDITRDRGWDAAHQAGLVGVSLVSVDETWSAMRFRPEAETKASRGK